MLETDVLTIGLAMNDSKIKFVTFNLTDEMNNLLSNIGNQSKHVPDYSIIVRNIQFLLVDLT